MEGCEILKESMKILCWKKNTKKRGGITLSEHRSLDLGLKCPPWADVFEDLVTNWSRGGAVWGDCGSFEAGGMADRAGHWEWTLEGYSSALLLT